MEFLKNDFVDKYVTLLETKKSVAAQAKGSYPKDLVIFKRSSSYQRVPVYRLYFYVITNVGCFWIYVNNIDFNYAYSAEVGIKNYRDLYVNIEHTTKFSFSFNFNYNIVKKRRGVYASGTLLYSKTQTGFRGVNFLPMILPK